MDTEELLQLFLNPKRGMPYLEIDDSKSYLYHFNSNMREYIQDLKLLDEKHFAYGKKDNIIRRINWIVDSMNKIFKSYLVGNPAKAYKQFKRLVKLADIKPHLLYSRASSIDANTTFFRTKKEYNPTKLKFHSLGNGFNKNLEPIDLFHVPFQKRRAIGSNRFSIPGYPCLYLSGSLKTSWSECFEKLEPFHATCFKNHRPLYIIDLVPLDYIFRMNGGSFPDEIFSVDDMPAVLLNYAIVFPLIFACHSKIKYVESYKGEIMFKSEYIIPQLLLQWFKEKKLVIDGVRYLSCTAETYYPSENFNKYNYILPAITSAEEGFCNNLLANFSGTPVYSYCEDDGRSLDSVLTDIVFKSASFSYTSLNTISATIY